MDYMLKMCFFIILGSIVNVVLEVGGRARGGGEESLCDHFMNTKIHTIVINNVRVQNIQRTGLYLNFLIIS